MIFTDKVDVHKADHCWEQPVLANGEPKLLKREGLIGCMHLILIHNRVSCLNSIAVTRLEIREDLTRLEIQGRWFQDRRPLAKEQRLMLTRSYQAWLELAR